MAITRARTLRGNGRAPAGVKLALAAALSLGLGGCLGYDGQVVHGYQLDPIADQVKARASAEQILVLLGSPTTTSTVGGDAWYYVTQVTDRVAFMPPKIVDQQVFAVYFDKTRKSSASPITASRMARCSISSRAPRRQPAPNRPSSKACSST